MKNKDGNPDLQTAVIDWHNSGLEFLPPPTKLDADQYSAEDSTGQTDNAVGTGNVNFLLMQAAMIRSQSVGETQSTVATYEWDSSAMNGAQAGANKVPLADGNQAHAGVRAMPAGAENTIRTAGDVSDNSQQQDTVTTRMQTSSISTSNVASTSSVVSNTASAQNGTNGTNGGNGSDGRDGRHGGGDDNTMPAVLDIAVLADARRVLKDKFEMTLQYYFQDTKTYLDQIHAAIIHHNLSSAVQPAHTIKSSSQNMGALRLSALARELEMIGRGNEADHVAFDEVEFMKRLVLMEAVFEETKAALLKIV